MGTIIHPNSGRLADSQTHPSTAITTTIEYPLLLDLGVIEVPRDYVHKDCLNNFYQKYCGSGQWEYYDFEIRDRNFPNPTRILKPGDKLHVRAFGGNPAHPTSEERMVFLRSQKAIHTGAQGMSLVFDQKRTELINGLWYASFDEIDRLWKDKEGHHLARIGIFYNNNPSIKAFEIVLGRFELEWYKADSFLCFNDVENNP